MTAPINTGMNVADTRMVSRLGPEAVVGVADGNFPCQQFDHVPDTISYRTCMSCQSHLATVVLYLELRIRERIAAPR